MAVFDNLNKSTSAGIAVSVKEQYYARELLENAKPDMVHSKDAQKRTLPKGNGKRIQFRKLTPFAAADKPLSEGVTPDGQTVTMTAFTAMVKPYGRHIETTDEFNLYTIDNMDRENAQLLSDQAALTLDTVARDSINSGLNVQYAGANTARGTIAATDKLTAAEIKKAVRTLQRNNAKPFPDGYYHAIVHPDTYYDLTGDSEWKDIAKYQNEEKFEKYELGKVYGVKFYKSTNAKIFSAESYLYGAVAALTLKASGLDTAKKSFVFTETSVTEDVARELAGKLVNVQYTSSETNYVTPMCIERVDVASKTVYFRWMPNATTTANWTTTNACEIVPMGGGASSAKVYSTVVYGQDSFGDVELDGNGKNVQIIINAPGSSGAADPLALKGTIAWKVKGYTSTILSDDSIVRIEHGATA